MSEDVTPPYLFVYGTLRAGAATEWSKFLTAKSRFIGFGRARGTLFHLGRYPGMTVGGEGVAWVAGEVYLLDDPRSALPLLDAYEGCEFERRVVTVWLDDGSQLEAFTYLYCLATEGRPQAEAPAEAYAAPLTSWLPEAPARWGRPHCAEGPSPAQTRSAPSPQPPSDTRGL